MVPRFPIRWRWLFASIIFTALQWAAVSARGRVLDAVETAQNDQIALQALVEPMATGANPPETVIGPTTSILGDVFVLQAHVRSLNLVADALGTTYDVLFWTTIVTLALAVVTQVVAFRQKRITFDASLDAVRDVLAQVEAEQTVTAKLKAQAAAERANIEKLRTLHGDQLDAIDQTLRPGRRSNLVFGVVGIGSLVLTVLIAIAEYTTWL